MQRSKKTKKKTDGNLIFLKNKLMAAGKKPSNAIEYFKRATSDNDIINYTKKLHSNPSYKNCIAGNPFPSEIKAIRQTEIVRAASLERELLWNAVIIKLYAEQINDFLKQKKTYINALILGQYELAHSVLNKIEALFGYSIWSVENRISLLQLSRGLDAQKEYTHQIANDENIDPFVRIIIGYKSACAEPNYSCDKYDADINHLLGYLDPRRFPSYKQYLSFKLNFYNYLNKYDFAFILSIEDNSPIIDRYMTFLKISQLIFISNSIDKLKLINIIEILSENIADDLIETLKIALGINPDLIACKHTTKYNEMLDRYIVGDYSKAANLASDLIKNNPSMIELYQIFIKSVARLPQYELPETSDSISSKVIHNLLRIILKKENSFQAYLDLKKLIYIFSGEPWASQLFSTLAKEYFSDSSSDLSDYNNIGLLNTIKVNPKIARIIPEENYRNTFLSKLSDTFNNSSIVKFFKATLSSNKNTILEEIDLPDCKKKKYSAIALMHAGQYAQATEIYKSMLDVHDYITYQDAICGLIRCYINLEKFSDCIDLLVAAFLKNNNLWAKLPIEEVLQEIENRNLLGDLYKNISLSITYDIYSKYYSPDKDIAKAEAYEEYLFSHGAKKPSQLIDYQSKIDNEKLIYFLRNICISSVMDSSVNFQSTEEIEIERIIICQILKSIDKKNDDLYSEEIKNITQKLLIDRALQDIEQSKIYVDIGGIRRVLEDRIKESYKRYTTITEVDKNNILSAENYIEIPNYSEEGEDIQALLPKDEKVNLLANILVEIRDKFVSSNEFGLDGYLSVNIRHGTLSGQLRSQLEISHLITQKDNTTNIYEDNLYWREKYGYFSNETLEILSKHLNEFSNEIDRLIDLLKNKWIQIKTEKKNNEGLFDFRISVDLINDLLSSPTTNYESFLDFVLNKLWTITDESLLVIRHEISTTLKEQFNQAFDNLLSNIGKLSVNLTELNNNIASTRTTLQYELDKIASWFTRSNKREIKDFSLDFAISIALEMLKNVYQGSSLNLTKNIQTACTVKGQTLQSFVTIIFYLFDNIIKHSNISNQPINSTIGLTNNDKKLIITLENEAITGNFDDYNRKLKNVKDSLAKTEASDKVRKEGGTGFHKIEKILSVDLGCKHSMNFDYTKENIFKICIEIDAEEIIA